MRPLNYWWPLVLYRHIMYMYSRKPARLCVAPARAYVCDCGVYIHVATRQVIYKYGGASPLARTCTHGSAKSVQREDTRGWSFHHQHHPSLRSFRRPYRLFQLSTPVSRNLLKSLAPSRTPCHLLKRIYISLSLKH